MNASWNHRPCHRAAPRLGELVGVWGFVCVAHTGCSGDRTLISPPVQQAEALASPERTVGAEAFSDTDPTSNGSNGGDGLAQQVSLRDAGVEPLVSGGRGHGKPMDAGAPGLVACSLFPPLIFRLHWSEPTLVQGAADCASLSFAPEADRAVWDGEQLSVGASTWLGQPFGVGRMRLCDRPRTTGAGEPAERWWRFHEALRWQEEPPSSLCLGQNLAARYTYEECPYPQSGGFLSVNSMCIENAESACVFEARVRFERIAPGDSGPPVDDSLLEPGCQPMGFPEVSRPVAIGEACSNNQSCEPQAYCWRGLPDGTCRAIGDGVCRRAPLLSECSPETQPACTCEQRIDVDGLNACRVEARGNTVIPCE